MTGDRGRSFRAATALATLVVSVPLLTLGPAAAAEWPRLPSEPTGEATVWDPGPRWPSLPSEGTEARPAGSTVEPRRAQPSPTADVSATQERRAQPSSPAAEPDITGSIPSIAAPATIPARDTRPARDPRPESRASSDADWGPAWPSFSESAAPAPADTAPRSTGAISSATAPIPKAPPVRPAYVVPVAPAPFRIDVGARYWYSTGKVDFGFRNGVPGYGDPTSTLDWRGMNGHAGEAFARIAHQPTRLFVKGLIGAGTLDGGTIVDRDFFAGQWKFSDTTSTVTGDSLRYGIVDAGWSFEVPKAGWRVGGFVGYHYWNETLGASGLITNPDDFGGAYWGVPAGTRLESDATAVFVYEPTWHALRLGVDGRWEFLPGWSVSGEVAWVPVAHVENKDSHLLRQGMNDLGPAPNVISRSSRGWGVEAELFVHYAVTPFLEIGAGGRYWGLNAGTGTVTFGPSFAQTYDLTRFEQQRYGLLLEAKGRF